MIETRLVNYQDPADRDALLHVLDIYSRDPMGAGEPLDAEVKSRLCDDLARFPGAVSFLAWSEDDAIGLINGFLGYSTFKARPLMNIHDIAVVPGFRGLGVGRQLLQAMQAHADRQGCCKLTLEVLSGNQPARQAYLKFGFEDYTLDPTAGTAMFMQKWL